MDLLRSEREVNKGIFDCFWLAIGRYYFLLRVIRLADKYKHIDLPESLQIAIHIAAGVCVDSVQFVQVVFAHCFPAVIGVLGGGDRQVDGMFVVQNF